MADDDIRATTVESATAGVAARAANIFQALRRLSPVGDMTRSLAERAVVVKRDLSDGAIAGTVVGVVIAAALLAFCLYPVIVHRLKRRRHADRPALDTEAGAALPPSPPGTCTGQAADPASHRRQSSTDSLKQDGDVCRNDVEGAQSKELGWAPPQDNEVPIPNGTFPVPSRQTTWRSQNDGGIDFHSAGEQALVEGFQIQEGSPFPFYADYNPDTPEENPGVLKGTSADYYSPSVPSEAFGMSVTPEPAELAEPVKQLSRASSFKYNVKQMFNRKSGRENSLASVLSSEDKSPSTKQAGSPGGHELRNIITTGGPTDSPTQLSPASISPPPPSAPRPTESPIEEEEETEPSRPAVKTPPQSKSPERAFRASPSPPAFPAAGTVNPMDIMAPSTESEMWHRTEHQLFASSYGSSHGFSSSSEPQETEQFSTFTPPPATSTLSSADAAQTAQSSTPTNSAQEDNGDLTMVDIHSHDHLSPSMIPEAGRHPSYPSDQSTPLLGPHSTGPSSENTPSTQIDSPSPASVNSSDFRHSASPQPVIPSPKTGLFRCNEPGCSQVFDQPHKLK